MAGRYSLYYVSHLPSLSPGRHIESAWPEPLLDGFEAPRTIFKLEQKLEAVQLEEFHVVHEDLVEQEGRAQGRSFDRFILKYRFSAFYDRSRQLMLLHTKKRIALQAIKMLAKQSSLVIEGQDIDLKTIDKLVPEYKAAHFSVNNSADVTSQAIYGPSIGYDFRFERAMKEGEMKSFRLRYYYEGLSYHVGVGRDSSIVVYHKNLERDFELSLVLNVFELLVRVAKVSRVYRL